MPAKPISLGPLHFAKRGEAADYLRDMLARYDLGDKVNAPDSQVLMAALNLHPDSRQKIGSGVSSFSVRSAEYGTRCFWVNRTDGTTENFSYRACIYT